VGYELTPFCDARPIPLTHECNPRTKGYTYDAKVWAVSIVQGPFSVAPCLP
jgi:hypothetical protein